MRKILLAAALLFCAAPAFAQCTATFQTEAIPLFFVGEHVNFQLEAVSGTAPYHFEIVDGELPDGLKLKGNGTIKGKPKEEALTVVFIRLTDAEGCGLTQAFNVEVWP
jgi:hypothetical protein